MGFLRKRAKMTNDEERVADLIRLAFRDVRLGDGIGLRQGRGLDDYANAARLAEYRSQDEKDDWSRIPVEDLNRYGGSLCFVDAEGMRFHLPAFLLADIQGNLSTDLLFHLTHFLESSRFGLLSEAQRHAVREYLLVRLSQAREEGNDFVEPMIEQALADYWTN